MVVNGSHTSRGSALLYGIILMGALVSASIPAVSLVISGLQRSNLGSDALQAHAVAESALENGLYKMRQTDWASQDFFIAPDDVGLVATVEQGIVDGHIVLNQPSATLRIAADDFSELDIRNEDIVSPAGINSLALTAPTVPPGNAAWVLVQWVTWNPNTGYSDSTAAQEFLFPLAALSGGGRQIVPLSGITSDQPYWYRVKFRALYDTVPELRVTAHHDIAATDEPVPLPMVEGLSVTGTVGRSVQQVQATMPRRSPLYGLFDYVIFSDSEISK